MSFILSQCQTLFHLHLYTCLCGLSEMEEKRGQPRSDLNMRTYNAHSQRDAQTRDNKTTQGQPDHGSSARQRPGHAPLGTAEIPQADKQRIYRRSQKGRDRLTKMYRHNDNNPILQNLQKYAMGDRLVGLVVKASTSRAQDPGFECHLRRDFSGVESYQ